MTISLFFYIYLLIVFENFVQLHLNLRQKVQITIILRYFEK